MAEDRFYVKFWGVRGSYPVADEEMLGYGGNTSCVEVRAGDHLVIIDAGTGIIKLGQEIYEKYLAKPKSERKNGLNINILMTHTHHDHTLGFGFFPPAFSVSTTVYILGPRVFAHDLEEIMSMSMLPPFFPVQLEDMGSMKVIHNIRDTHVIVFDEPGAEPKLFHMTDVPPDLPENALKVYNYRTYAHPQGGCTIYKFVYKGKTFVHGTDTEGYSGGDARLIRFARGADLLSHDAQYADEDYAKGTFQGFGHSTPSMAAEVAKHAKVKQLGLIHHDPRHNDERVAELEAVARDIFPDTVAVREGQRFDLL
ncbi:MAG: MBL fold metallo-hydrolase [Candidatus Coatesbacteria bacterium]|nr:MBL fold metallo-hydrolase [Candidatus Coatesbacteria bacterium]